MTKAVWISVVMLLLALPGRAQTNQEWKLDLAKYGFVKIPCAGYTGRVEFLDDEHLVISAPADDACHQPFSEQPEVTRVTVVDLHGQVVASVKRSIFELFAGPVGYAIVCSANGVELLSRDLALSRLISPSQTGTFQDCSFGGGLSPSRTAFIVAGPEKRHFRLYQGAASEPIAEITVDHGQSVKAAADDGFLVCSKEQCETLDSKGVKQKFPAPQLAGGSGSEIVGLVSPDRVLMASFDGKRLYAETPAGASISMGDVAKLKPPFINGNGAEMSAAEPRRILYLVDGCLLGDFDDCYGVVFRRFAVFDSQTSRMLFRHGYPQGATLKISPNGHLVMERVGAIVHFYSIR